MKKVALQIGMLFLLLQPPFAIAQTRLIDSLKEVLPTLKEDTNKVDVLSTLSEAYWLISDNEQSIKYADPALKLAEKLNNKNRIARANVSLGNIQEDYGNFDKALDYYVRALKSGEENGFDKLVATACYDISNVKRKQGEYEEAMTYCLKALKYIKADDKDFTARVYNLLAIINSILGNVDATLDYSNKALRIFEEMKFTQGSAGIYINLGEFYFSQGNYSQALNYDTLALRLMKEIDDKMGISACLTDLGNAYRGLGNFEQALNYLLQSLKMDKELGDNYSMAIEYSDIGYVLMKQNRFSESLDSLYKALSIAKEIGAKDVISNTYNYLSETYYQLHNLDSTHYYLNLSLAMKDSLFTEESIRQLNDMQVKYETEKKEKQITELNLENEKRQSQLALLTRQHQISELNLKTEQQQKELITSENERNKQSLLLAGNMRKQQEDSISNLSVQKTLITQLASSEHNKRNWATAGGIGIAALLSLVFYQLNRRRQTKHSLQINQLNNKVLRAQLNPHFIFNALNSIRSYIQQHPEVADSYLTKFSILMRQVLENSEEEKIPLEEEIAMLENYMQLESILLPLGFDYEVSVDESTDAANTMVPPLIFQPMVENAIIHGLRPLSKRGKINLRFTETNGFLQAIIEDNGIGEFSTVVSTRSGSKKRSMGMQITRERIELINKKSRLKGWLEQQLFEHGSNVKIAIPLQ